METLHTRVGSEHAVLYQGHPIAIREDYDEALWALHEHMRTHTIPRQDLQIVFRLTITVHTPWQEVDKNTNYDHLINQILPPGTLLPIH